MLRYRSFLFLIVVLVMSPFLANATIRVGVTPWSAHFPLHVAQEQGLWMAENLDAILVPFDTDEMAQEAIRAGKVDYALARVGDVVGLVQSGWNLKILMEVGFSIGDHVLLVREGFSFRDWLKGPVGTIADSPALWFFIDASLKAENLSILNYRMIPLPGEALVQNYVGGRMPILVVTKPWADKAKGLLPGRVAVSTADMPEIMPFCLYTSALRLDTFSEEELYGFLWGWLLALADLEGARDRQQKMKGSFGVRSPVFDLEGISFHDPLQLQERNATGGGLDRHIDALHRYLKRNGKFRIVSDPRHLVHRDPALALLQQQRESQ